MWSNLLQRWVWNSKAAQPDVGQRLLQLSEQTGVRAMSEAPAGQQEGQFLTYDLDQPGLWSVMLHESCDAFNVPWWKCDGFTVTISLTEFKIHLITKHFLKLIQNHLDDLDVWLITGILCKYYSDIIILQTVLMLIKYFEPLMLRHIFEKALKIYTVKM